MDEPKRAEAALVPLTLEEEEERTRRVIAKAERKKARLMVRNAKLASMVQDILMEAAVQVNLRKHAHKPAEEKAAAKLTAKELALISEWEKPKKEVSFAVESSSRLVEAQIRVQQASKAPTVNVTNMTIQIPEKRKDDVEAVVIDVEVGK